MSSIGMSGIPDIPMRKWNLGDWKRWRKIIAVGTTEETVWRLNLEKLQEPGKLFGLPIEITRETLRVKNT